MKYKNFTVLLLQWHTNVNKREMPWKGVKDPYKVWLSEIILQQTRVDQGWAYYEKFLEKYPTIKHLAKDLVFFESYPIFFYRQDGYTNA